MIHFEGRFDLATFRQAWWLHLRRAVLGWQALATVYGLLAAVSLAAALVTRSLAAARPALAIMLLALLLVAWFAWSTRRTWRRREDLHQPISGSLDAEGMELSTSSETSRIAWADLEGWIGTKELLLLVNEKTFHLLPRELFATADEWNSAQLLVRAAVPAHERQARRALHPVILIAVIAFVLVLLWAFLPLLVD